MSDQDTVTVSEAARILGTTNERIARLVKRGILTSRVSNLDRRRRLIPRKEVERILQQERYEPPVRPKRDAVAEQAHPRPHTFGIYSGPLKVTSDQVDDYLTEHWEP